MSAEKRKETRKKKKDEGGIVLHRECGDKCMIWEPPSPGELVREEGQRRQKLSYGINSLLILYRCNPGKLRRKRKGPGISERALAVVGVPHMSR